MGVAAVLTLWTLCAFAAALVAARKGREPVAWFCYGLVLGPIALGAIALAGSLSVRRR